MRRAESVAEFDNELGAPSGEADFSFESVEADGLPGDIDRGRVVVGLSGVPGRYLDAETMVLGYYAATWQDFGQMRKATAQRGLDDALVAELARVEARIGERVKKALRAHPLWPWLSQFPGLGGVHTARLIARIGDPRRFPGHPCSIGHHLPYVRGRAPLYAIGGPCPIRDREGAGCPGLMLLPRENADNTGTRALRHYLGLHVVDGRSPRKTRGQKADWDPLGRTAVLQPDGIADAIVRNRVPIYRERYDREKERLTRERGADVRAEIVRETGPAPRPSELDDVLGQHAGGAGVDETAGSVTPFGPRPDDQSESEVGYGAGVGGSRAIADVAGPRPHGPQSEIWNASDSVPGLRPFQIDAIARKIAAKAFVGDLLAEWKRISGADDRPESEGVRGPAEAAA